jgi:hypothetical protein
MSLDTFTADLMDRTVVREKEELLEFTILPPIGPFTTRKEGEWTGLKVYYKLDPLSLHEESFMPVKGNTFLDHYDEENFDKIKRLVSTFLVDKNLFNEYDPSMLQDFSNIIVTEFETGLSICIKIKISIDSVVVIQICPDDLVGEVKECICNNWCAAIEKQRPFSSILK